MVKIKKPDELKKMRKLGRMSSIVMRNLVRFTKPGISTKDIEHRANYLMEKLKVKPAFLGYKDYPSSVCVSLNEELIHGIPSVAKFLNSGDLVSIDLGLYNGEFYADTAFSFCLGKPLEIVKDLIRVGRGALSRAIKIVRAGATLGDVGWVIQSFVESCSFCVVRKFVGHGIGRDLHEEPEIPNFGRKGEGVRLREGMTLAIEPMITVDSAEVEILEDGWTVVSKDRKPCVHFEHTVAVLKRKAQILTK